VICSEQRTPQLKQWIRWWRGLKAGAVRGESFLLRGAGKGKLETRRSFPQAFQRAVPQFAEFAI
jgi:hypothetical protein